MLEQYELGQFEQKREIKEVSESDQDRFVLQLMYALKAPIIVTPGSDYDSYKQFEPKITLKRLLLNEKIHAKKRATDLEVFFYLQSATLLAPPNHTAYRAIEYLCRKEFPEAAEAAGFSEVDIEKEPLSSELIDRLGSDIYRDQMKHLKLKLKKGQPA